jgi:hypothetical protein
MTGCGTNTVGAAERPATRVVDRTTFSKMSVWSATVGTP